MKFYCGLSDKFVLNGGKESISLSDYASQFGFEDNQCILKKYGFKDLYGFVISNNEPLLVYQNMSRPPQNIRDEVEDNSLIWVENTRGDILDVPPEKLALYYSYAPYGKEVFEGANFAGFNNLFPEEGYNSLLSYNVDSDKYYSLHGRYMYFPQKIGDDCYVSVSYKRGYSSVERYNPELNLQWSYEEKASVPYTMDRDNFIDNGDSVVRNFKYEKLKTSRVDESGQRIPAAEYINGEIYCFAKADGKILWKRQFEKQVDNLISFDNERLLAYTCSDLHLLDRENGESLEIFSTPITHDTYFRAESRLLIHQGFLFLCHGKANQLLIYDIKTMQCVREENIDALGSRMSCLYALENRVYVTFNLYRKVSLPWSGLLEIDCDDIQAPLEIEDDNVFKLIDSTAEDGCITLIADGLRIDDIVRLGEYQLLEQMQIYGKCFFNETTVNKDFNGFVKLVIRNCLTEPERVQEIVAMMEKRFEYFIKDADYKDGKGKALCRFSVEVRN